MLECCAAHLATGEPVRVVSRHPDGQGRHASLDQPGRMRIDGWSPEHHQPGDFFDQRGGARDGAGDHVAVPVQVLGGAGDHDVGAVLQGAEVDGAREGRVHQEGQAGFLGDLRHRNQIEQAEQGIGRRLDENGAGGLADRPAPEPGLVGLDVADLDAEARELLVEEAAGPAVDPRARQQVVAGAEDGEVGQRGRRHPAGEEDGGLRPFHRRILLRQAHLVGVVAVPRVHDLFVGPDRIGERAALVDRSHYRRPIRPPVRRAMHSECRQSEFAFGHESGIRRK